MKIHRRPTNTFLNVSVRNLEIFKIVVGKVVVEISAMDIVFLVTNDNLLYIKPISNKHQLSRH